MRSSVGRPALPLRNPLLYLCLLLHDLRGLVFTGTSESLYDNQPPTVDCDFMHVVVDDKHWIITQLLDEKNYW